MRYSEVKLIVADLDGTLSESKTPMDSEMASLVCEMLKYKDFAVISGGSYKQFQDQFVGTLSKYSKNLQNLYLFPTCATSMYVMKDGEWKKIYGYEIDESTKKEIFKAFDKALKEYGFEKPKKLYGELIEDRSTQITFSAFGQLAPLEVKNGWDPDSKKRLEIISHLSKYLPNGFEAKAGGSSSIDVTKVGIDKAYGIRKIEEELGFKVNDMLFLGDKLFEGGNDYPVTTTGVKCIAVADPQDTKKIIRQIISDSR